jgi:transposase
MAAWHKCRPSISPNQMVIVSVHSNNSKTKSKWYGVSRKTYYKWMSRYKQKGIEGLLDTSRRPHNIKYKKVMEIYIISRLSSKG